MNQPVSKAFHSAHTFVRQRIAGPRAAALLCCSVLLPLLAGCGHTVRFADLKLIEQVADVSTLRDASQHGLTSGLPRSDDYLVGSSDLIELKAADGSLVQPISDICAKACKGGAECDRIEGDVDLAENGRKVRVTAFVLSSVSALRIKKNGKDGQKQVCMGPVLGQPWSRLKRDLTSLGVVPSILPQPTRWAMPGDTVRVAVEFRFGLRQGAGVEPYTFAEMGTTVDGAGRAYVPAFWTVRPEVDAAPVARAEVSSNGPATATPSAAEADAAAAQSQPSALRVVAEQQAQSAARHVVFWMPGRPLAEQPTLDRLERCLKAVSSTVVLNAAFAHCPELGIDQYRYQPNATHNRQVSYRLLAEYKVTFVFWDGRRHAVPYRAGQAVAEATRAIHQDVVGRDISSYDRLFATVVPHMAIRAGGERPFYAPVVAAQGAILDQVLLLPGDVVYLSRSEPQRPL